MVILAGCSDMAPAKWLATPEMAADRQRIVKEMAEALVRQGFEIERRDDSSGLVDSKWKVRLGPQWRTGFRDRVEMRLITPAQGKYVVQVRTSREVNDNGKKPMSESEAIWMGWGGNDDLSEKLTYLLRMKIVGIKVDD